MLRLCRSTSVQWQQQRGAFLASNAPTNIVKGREDRKLMAPEYISPQNQAPHSLWKRIVRQDCLRRRQQIDLPEFYPGSILAVVYADKHAPEKRMRFVGRVLYVTGFGTNHKMLLRNIVDDVAVNIKFDLYSPLLHEVQVIKLEKWQDANLDYLRKYADAEYCRIPFDMMPEVVPPPNVPIPTFSAKVMMKAPERDVKPPTDDNTLAIWGNVKKGWKQGTTVRRHMMPRKRLMFVNRPKPQRRWPAPNNIFLEEDMIKEDEIVRGYQHRRDSWQKYDIMRHHNYDDEHDEIIVQMARNAQIIPRITKTIGRPKVDYSKIAKLWTENYTVKNTRTLPPQYTA